MDVRWYLISTLETKPVQNSWIPQEPAYLEATSRAILNDKFMNLGATVN